MLKLVPFNSNWITHDKIDVHAVYRRPRYVEDAYGEKVRELDKDTGEPTWDLACGLPVKSHNLWLAKGFQYVTLSDRLSLQIAGRLNTVLDDAGQPCDWRKYDQHQTGGPWNYKKYNEGLQATTTREADQLKADIEEFGWETVEKIRRGQDPTFRVPEHMKRAKDAPKGKKAESIQ